MAASVQPRAHVPAHVPAHVRAHVRFWGTRGTCPSPGPHTVRYGGNTSCVEVRDVDGTLVILDAGTGIRALGAHLEATQHDAPIHLFLTHRHSDHVSGLAHFAPLYRHRQRIRLCGGDGESDPLAAFTERLLSPPLCPAIPGLHTRLEIAEWGPDTEHRAGGMSVHRFTARHPGAAAIFRLDDATGPLVAYAPDNELSYGDGTEAVRAWRRALGDFLADVPVLVHDATYRDDELPRHRGWGHSSHVEATSLALECGARTLVLFHHHPDRDDDGVERMLDECRTLVSREGTSLQVLAAWEGLTLSV